MPGWLSLDHSGLVYLHTVSAVGSGGPSAVKEPGHFEVRRSSSQVTRMLQRARLTLGARIKAPNGGVPSHRGGVR